MTTNIICKQTTEACQAGTLRYGLTQWIMIFTMLFTMTAGGISQAQEEPENIHIPLVNIENATVGETLDWMRATLRERGRKQPFNVVCNSKHLEETVLPAIKVKNVRPMDLLRLMSLVLTDHRQEVKVVTVSKGLYCLHGTLKNVGAERTSEVVKVLSLAEFLQKARVVSKSKRRMIMLGKVEMIQDMRKQMIPKGSLKVRIHPESGMIVVKGDIVSVGLAAESIAAISLDAGAVPEQITTRVLGLGKVFRIQKARHADFEADHFVKKIIGICEDSKLSVDVHRNGDLLIIRGTPEEYDLVRSIVESLSN